MSRVAIIQGHPDPAGGHYGHRLADAYAEGAAAAGHELKRIEVARLDFPLLRTKAEFEQVAPVSDIRDAQDAILWADHLVLLYPLWLGTMPALLKAFLEQALRPGFAFDESSRMPRKLLKGRSARIVVTMVCRRSFTTGISGRTACAAWSATFSAFAASARSARA
jgi:putative NADPH-quinone reductase